MTRDNDRHCLGHCAKCFALITSPGCGETGCGPGLLGMLGEPDPLPPLLGKQGHSEAFVCAPPRRAQGGAAEGRGSDKQRTRPLGTCWIGQCGAGWGGWKARDLAGTTRRPVLPPGGAAPYLPWTPVHAPPPPDAGGQHHGQRPGTRAGPAPSWAEKQ